MRVRSVATVVNPGLRIGASLWTQHTDWPELLEAVERAERLGYDSLWTWDHLLPPLGSIEGPILEGWLTVTAWAQATTRPTIGLMVGANTFRPPALVAKMATTLDHISGGRAVLGIGAGWFEAEHQAFGLPFGDGPPDRLRGLAAALPIIRAALDGVGLANEAGSASPRAKILPTSIQPRIPILIGGAGERVTLRLMAAHADSINFIGDIDTVRRKERILLEHCAEIGRDPTTIERTVGLGSVVIRDRRDAARRAYHKMMEINGGAPVRDSHPIGTADDVVAHIAPFLDLGFTHLIAGFSAPYDEESMARLQEEVRPRLELVSSSLTRTSAPDVDKPGASLGANPN